MLKIQRIVQKAQSRTLMWEECARWLKPKESIFSEVVEMTNGLIAGKGGAADILGLPPSTLRNRMKKLGIKF